MRMLTERCSEKYVKTLIGKAGMEDALKRLDKLTREEAQMAAAQNLKVTHTVEERVKSVADTVATIDIRMTSVDDRVAGVFDQMARVDDRVASVNDTVITVDDRVKVVDSRVIEALAGMSIIFSQFSKR